MAVTSIRSSSAYVDELVNSVNTSQRLLAVMAGAEDHWNFCAKLIKGRNYLNVAKVDLAGNVLTEETKRMLSLGKLVGLLESLADDYSAALDHVINCDYPDWDYVESLI